MSNRKYYNVRQIVGKKFIKQNPYYKILWENYSDEDFTWEPLENLLNVIHLIDKYEQQHKAQLPHIPVNRLCPPPPPKPKKQVGSNYRIGEILGIVQKDQKERKLWFQIRWEPRQEGDIGEIGVMSNEQLKKVNPIMLINYYSSQIHIL